MKKIIFALLVLMAVNNSLKAQSPTEQLANKIAQKMKDTLQLTAQERNQVYAINIALHNLKATARQQYTNPESLRYTLQTIENKRDSLYQTILSENKYLLYKQKKRNLVNNN